MRHGFDRGVMVGIVVLTAIMGGIGITSYANTRRLRDDTARATSSREFLDLIGDLDAETRKLQAAQRAYLVTGFPDWRKPYEEASALIRAAAARLAALTAEDPEQHARAVAAGQDIESGIAKLDAVVKLRGEPNGYEAVVALARQNGLRSFPDSLPETLAAMEHAERTRLAQREAQVRDAYSRAVFQGLSAVVLGLVAVAGLSVLLLRGARASTHAADYLAAQRERLRITLASIGDAVISTDAGGRVTFLNGVAETLTGWPQAEAVGKSLQDIFRIVNETTREPVVNPALRALDEGVIVGLANHTILVARDGTERPIDDSAAPIRDEAGSVAGAVLVFRDITARQQAEAERARLAETLGLVLAAADLGTWEWDPATDLITLSARAAEIYALPPGQLYTREWMRGLLHPDYRDRARNAAVRAVAARADYDLEYPLALSSGTVWVSVRGRGVYDASGELTRMLGVVQDVTARKQVEADGEGLHRQVEAERQRLADVFQAAPSFMCVLQGPEHVFERANDRYFELLGRRDIIGRTVREAIPEVEGQGFFEILDRVYQTGEAHIGTDARLTLQRGGRLEERVIEFVYQPFRDAERTVIGIIVQGIDLTARKQAEDELARVNIESERRRRLYEAILSSTPDFVYVFSLDHHVLYANESLVAMWGQGPEGPIGKTFLEIGYEPWHAEMHNREIDTVRDTKRPIRGEVPFVGTLGRRVYDYIFVPVFGPDGEVEAVAGTTRDVTDRKREQEALEASEEQYRTLFTSIDQGFCVIEVLHDSSDRPVDYRFLEANPAFERHTGLVGAVGHRVKETVPDQDDHWFETYGRVVASGEPVRFTNESSALGRHFEVYAFRLGDPSRRRVAVLFTDITARVAADRERERLHAQVDAERRLLDAVFEALPVGAVVADPHGRLVRMNRANVELWGGPPPTNSIAEYRPWVGWWPATGRRIEPEEWPLARVLLTGEPVTGDAIDIERFDGGGRRHIVISGAPVRDAEGRLVAGVIASLDVTDRKRAEERLRVSEERFRTTADHAPVLIWIADTTRAYVWFNRPWLEFTGRTMSQEYGIGWVEGVHPDDFARCLQVYATNFEARTPFKMEYRLKRRDGAYRWLLDNGTPLFGPGGEFAGYIGSCVDVTDRWEMEEALREADRKKDDFIALLAHELRNPLAPIRTGLQVIRLAEDRATRDRSQAMMDRQLAHMVRLIDDLLDVSRISRNKMQLRRDVVTLANVIESAVETARPAIEEAGHTLTIRLPDQPVYLDADLTRLSQVFSNLLTNSAKYTERGGRIWLTAAESATDVAVSVRDTGIGIPAAALPAIFDMFAQVDRPIERSTGGLGIGLALVKGLVEMHGGTVTAASPGEGQGSTFTVILPCKNGASNVFLPTTDDKAGTVTRPSRRILVVDDNRDAATSLGMMLELIGSEVTTAHDGLEAVERAERFRPEIILMDIGMPKLNGLEATRRIRQESWGQKVTIIALTGWGQDSDRERSREAGCDGHLVKPVSMPDLEKLLGDLRQDVE